MEIEIWSDVMCPWCAIGKARFEAALAGFAQRDAVHVRWRSFELDPQAPRVQPGDMATRLAQKYGTGVERARAMMDHVTQTAAEVGLTFDFSKAQPGNTFDAHRLLHLAAARGRQDALKTRLMAAYLCEGEAVGRPEVLQRLAEAAGLDATEVATVLGSDAFADDVRADERMAGQIGVRGVPFFVLDGRYGVSGAQPVEVFAQALAQAWGTRTVTPLAVESSGGPVCGDDGCAI